MPQLPRRLEFWVDGSSLIETVPFFFFPKVLWTRAKRKSIVADNVNLVNLRPIPLKLLKVVWISFDYGTNLCRVFFMSCCFFCFLPKSISSSSSALCDVLFFCLIV